MARRVLAVGLVLVALVAAGCSRSDVGVQPAAAARDLGAQQVFRQQVFAHRDTGALRLDLFLPKRRGSATPLIVYVHGGGWHAGERSLDARHRSAEALAAQRLLANGYAVATVDYRLAGVARSPAQLVDVADAVRWLQQNSARWGLDANRVGLWGASAGGHLVAQLGAVAGEPSRPGGGLSGIRAVVDWFGPSDLTAAPQDRPGLSDYAHRAVTGLLGCSPADCPEVAGAVSPVHALSGDEPPFLIQHGTADRIVPLAQSLDLAAALRSRGGTVEMRPYQGLGHGFAGQPQTALVVDALEEFVREHV